MRLLLIFLITLSFNVNADMWSSLKSKGQEFAKTKIAQYTKKSEPVSEDRVRENDINNFKEAKVVLKKKVYNAKGMKETFYCGCNYKGAVRPSLSLKKAYYYKVDTQACGFEAPIGHDNPDWSKEIEIEHLFTSHALGKDLPCWKKGGRDECVANSAVYNERASDLRNLVPAIKLVNRDRLNYKFSDLPGEPTDYGSCGLEIDKRNRLVEPSDDVKGDIARGYLYMSDRYSVPITASEEAMYNRWAKLDPMDAKESNRLKRIEPYNR